MLVADDQGPEAQSSRVTFGFFLDVYIFLLLYRESTVSEPYHILTTYIANIVFFFSMLKITMHYSLSISISYINEERTFVILVLF